MNYKITVRFCDAEHVVLEETVPSWENVLEKVDELVESGVFNRFTVRCKGDTGPDVVVDFDKVNWSSPRERLQNRLLPRDRVSHAYGG